MNRNATTSTASKKISAILAVVALALVFSVPQSNPVGASSGDPPTGRTGAPPSEGTCFDCHNDFTDNDPSFALFDLYKDDFTTTYAPGDTIPMVIASGSTGMTRWGFEVTALNSGNTAAGTFIDDGTYDRARFAGGRYYVGHTDNYGSDGTFPGQANAAVWYFQWVAPAAGAGTITFYFSGVAADNDNTNGGDYVRTKTLALTEEGTTDVEATTWGRLKTLYR